jgi:hypothetical protein
MQCGDEIRVNGVAPIPVADAQAHKIGVKTRRLHQLSCAAGQNQPKNARGLGRSPISATGAVPPSLDSIQNKCDTPNDPYRKKKCGRLTLLGISAKANGVGRFFKVTCKCWDCPQCGPRKANRVRRSIGQASEQHKLTTLLTLTLDPSKLSGRDSTRFINEVFADFRIYMKRRLGLNPKYIRVLEHQGNGNAHLHILLNCYLKQSWVSDAWAALGGGKVVDIRRVDMHRASHYLSKYLTKEMLMSAPKRTRRVTTSRSIKLNPKRVSDSIWRLIHIPIEYLYEVHKCTANNVLYDIEGNITGFESVFPME